MARKFARRRAVVVAAFPVVLAAVVAAVAAGSGAGTSGKAATRAYGIARASSAGVVNGGSAVAAAATPGPQVIDGKFQGTSPDVDSLPVLPVPQSPLRANGIESLTPSGTVPGAKDPVVQKAKGTGPISGPIQNFDGICLPVGEPCAQPSSCSCLPPDTDGEVGSTQYVQMVNSDFIVFSKAGAVLRGATPIDQLWAGTSSECATHNDGDPVVVTTNWPPLAAVGVRGAADRHRAVRGVHRGPTTSSATGSYYLYEFDFGRTFHDYPKLGVWPDAYYMSSNEFPDGSQTSAGAGAFAFERARMLAANGHACLFDESAYNPAGGQYIGQLPTDLDGSTLPPAGSPNLFAEIDDASTITPTDGSDGFVLRLWKFHVDWANPSTSTFGDNGQPSYKLPVAPYVRPQCVYGYGRTASRRRAAHRGSTSSATA